MINAFTFKIDDQVHISITTNPRISRRQRIKARTMCNQPITPTAERVAEAAPVSCDECDTHFKRLEELLE